MPGLFAALFLVASPMQADPNDATIEQAVAVAIARAMPDLRYPWQLDWSAFGIYASRDVRWHLTGPADIPHRDAPAGSAYRTGWMSLRGASASVAACGDDDRVGAMMMETSDIWLDDGDLTADLAEAGVVATLLEQRDRSPLLAGPGADELSPHYVAQVSARPAHRLMRLEQAGREPALLTASYLCTGPGTRSATRCTMHWTLELRAAAAPRQDVCFAPTEPHVRLD